MALCARNPNPPIMLDDSFKFSWSYTLYFDQFKQKFDRYGISSLDVWLWKGRQTPLAYVFLGAHGQYIYFIKREFEVLSFTFKLNFDFWQYGVGVVGSVLDTKTPSECQHDEWVIYSSRECTLIFGCYFWKLFSKFFWE